MGNGPSMIGRDYGTFVSILWVFGKISPVKLSGVYLETFGGKGVGGGFKFSLILVVLISFRSLV